MLRRVFPCRGRPPGKYVVIDDRYQFEFVLLFESDDREVLTGIEVWRCRDEAADIRFFLEGIDVLRTPAEELPEVLVERGHEVVESNYGFEEVTDLGLRFANNSSLEYPVDEEGDPLYYHYVLVMDGT